MKAKIYVFFLLNIFVFGVTHSQNKNLPDTSTAFFNYAYWNAVADKEHMSPEVRAELIAGQKKIFYDQLAHKHEHIDEKDIVWTPISNGKGYSQNTTNAGPCTNIDFESGSFAGWTRSTGYNPLANAMGCCPNPNGDQTIVTGAGVDPFGLFPVVYPGGGSFSLRLGSTAIGGIADRISQTFFVTPANANFTYRYAVVLNDPATGHTQAQKPKFTSEIIDTLGNPILCTTYSVIAGGGIPGFTTSALTANSGAVVTKAWTNVAVDLSPNIGQNVTIRFTVYDCGPTGHFAYAYLDGVCTNFATSVADTTCPNVPIPMCAPAGFSTTTWNGPGFINDPNQCILATIPGTYTCTTLLVPGCPGPTFTHTLTTLDPPLVSFTPVTTGPCSPTYTFNSTIGIATGSIVSYSWDFGDGFGSTNSLNPTHTYATSGTYPVKLKAVSNRGCVDSVVNFITVFPFPNLSFSPPSNCVNTIFQFTNTSMIGVGTITSYVWSSQVGPNSSLANPTEIYNTPGTVTITLVGTSNQGCSSSITQTLGIFPPPVISFSANPLCDITGTSFSPTMSIASGSLAIFNWNFGDGGTSTQANPVHTYTAPGTYTVSFTAISNHNCMATISNTIGISSTPTIAFSTTSLNACSRDFTFTNNSASISGPINYTWSFGGTNTTTATSPSYTFPSIGNYTVALIGISSTGCADTAFQFISVYPYPIINFSVPASCENAIFTVSTTAVSGSVTSYLWNFGDIGSGVNNSSTLQNPTHFYSTTGIYTLNLDIISNLNCPSSYSTLVTIFPNPVSLFTYTTANNCSLPYAFVNSSSVSPIGASALVSYKWSFGGVGTSNVANPGTISFPGNGNYSVSLIATTNHNCSDTMSANILVHPLPQLNFTVDPTCVNVPVIITSTGSISAIPSATSSIASYTWNLGDNTFTNTLNQAPHNYTASGTYTLSLGGTSNMGCVNNVTHTLVIFPAASIDFTTSSNMCFGNTTQFTGTHSIATGTVFAFNWDFGDGTMGSNQNTTHTYSTSNTFPVTFFATTNNECVTSQTKTVTVHPLPVISFTTNGGCLNTPSQFATTASISLGSISSFSWNFGDGGSSGFQNPPPHTYTVPGPYSPTLTATSNQNCSVTVTNTLLIDPLPQVSFSPPGSCVNALIQFTNSTAILSGNVVSYVWNFADGTPTTGITNPLHTYILDASYPVTLTATSDKSCVQSTVSTVMIHPYPSGTITPINSSCINNLVSINPNITITGANNPVPSYTLSYGDGSPAVIQQSTLTLTTSHTYTAYNTYTVSITANSSNNCARTFTSTVIVYPRPFVNFTSTNHCLKNLTQFANSSTISAQYSITNFYWNFDDGAVSTSTLSNPGYTFSASGVHNVSLTAYSQPEATLACNQTAVKSVTINPLPPGVSFTSNSVCLGSGTSFNNTTPTLGITGWSWFHSTPGLVTGVGQNSSFTYTNSGQHTATLIALNSFGCHKDTTGTVVIYQNPVASFTTNNNCFGDPSIFVNTTTFPEGSASSYLWSVGTTTLSTATDATYPFSTPGTFSVTLTANSNLGCTNKYTTTITVHPLPTVNFYVPSSCLHNVTPFTNLSSGSNNTYNWTFGDPGSGASNTSNAVNPTHLYSNSGSYSASLQATTDKNCTAITTTNVIVHNKPNADFTSTTICTGDPLTFANLSSSTDGVLSNNYWDFNGDNIFDKDEFNPSYTFTLPGNYQLTLITVTEYGCADTATKQFYSNPKPVGAISSNNKTGCPSLCIDFKDGSTISSGTIVTTTWDFGDDDLPTTVPNPSHCFNSGTYDISLTLVSDMGCKTKFVHPAYVSVYPPPTAGFKVEPEQIDEDEPVITVSNQSSGDVNFIKYYINDGSSFGTPNFTHYIKNLKQTKPMVVQVVKNQYGCADTTYQVLDIKPAFVIYFPNVFTPNGDGNNDDFRPKGVGITKFTMQIYDRWGHQVFKTNEFTDTWDGKARNGDESIKEDIYTWKAQVTDVFNKNHFMVGHVTVIR